MHYWGFLRQDSPKHLEGFKARAGVGDLSEAPAPACWQGSRPAWRGCRPDCQEGQMRGKKHQQIFLRWIINIIKDHKKDLKGQNILGSDCMTSMLQCRSQFKNIKDENCELQTSLNPMDGWTKICISWWNLFILLVWGDIFMHNSYPMQSKSAKCSSKRQVQVVWGAEVVGCLGSVKFLPIFFYFDLALTWPVLAH